MGSLHTVFFGQKYQKWFCMIHILHPHYIPLKQDNFLNYVDFHRLMLLKQRHVVFG